MAVPQSTKMKLPSDLEIPPLGMHLRKVKHMFTQKLVHECACMLLAALFIIAKERKQLRCPWTEKWINKMWPSIQQGVI